MIDSCFILCTLLEDGSSFMFDSEGRLRLISRHSVVLSSLFFQFWEPHDLVFRGFHLISIVFCLPKEALQSLILRRTLCSCLASYTTLWWRIPWLQDWWELLLCQSFSSSFKVKFLENWWRSILALLLIHPALIVIWDGLVVNDCCFPSIVFIVLLALISPRVRILRLSHRSSPSCRAWHWQMRFTVVIRRMVDGIVVLGSTRFGSFSESVIGTHERFDSVLIWTQVMLFLHLIDSMDDRTFIYWMLSLEGVAHVWNTLIRSRLLFHRTLLIFYPTLFLPLTNHEETYTLFP